MSTIAFIGAGNMASSLIGGLMANGYDADQIWASNPSREKRDQLRENFKIHTTEDNHEAAQQANILVLGVKPQILRTVAKDLSRTLKQKKPLVISIAAGIQLDSLQRWLGGDLAIVRSMPNTPALIGCSATGLFANDLVTEEQRDLAESVLKAVGITLWLDNEKQMDVLTALSGSGPAYFYLVMEALEQTAEVLGLNKETARLMILQTALGASRMALESGKDIATLRKNVTSPGGVTEQAIRALESGGVRQLFSYALQEANRRSEEIALSLGDQA